MNRPGRARPIAPRPQPDQGYGQPVAQPYGVYGGYPQGYPAGNPGPYMGGMGMCVPQHVPTELVWGVPQGNMGGGAPPIYNSPMGPGGVQASDNGLVQYHHNYAVPSGPSGSGTQRGDGRPSVPVPEDAEGGAKAKAKAGSFRDGSGLVEGVNCGEAGSLPGDDAGAEFGLDPVINFDDAECLAELMGDVPNVFADDDLKQQKNHGEEDSSGTSVGVGAIGDVMRGGERQKDSAGSSVGRSGEVGLEGEDALDVENDMDSNKSGGDMDTGKGARVRRVSVANVSPGAAPERERVCVERERERTSGMKSRREDSPTRTRAVAGGERRGERRATRATAKRESPHEDLEGGTSSRNTALPRQTRSGGGQGGQQPLHPAKGHRTPRNRRAGGCGEGREAPADAPSTTGALEQQGAGGSSAIHRCASDALIKYEDTFDEPRGMHRSESDKRLSSRCLRKNPLSGLSLQQAMKAIVEFLSNDERVPPAARPALRILEPHAHRAAGLEVGMGLPLSPGGSKKFRGV